MFMKSAAVRQLTVPFPPIPADQIPAILVVRRDYRQEYGWQEYKRL
jgi:hypothetical protein